uniref:Uncharacterized protein n=1 Tax=Rhizophora mucronata TaxID=61149 RepID=A0A2P2IQ26_RHIMU
MLGLLSWPSITSDVLVFIVVCGGRNEVETCQRFGSISCNWREIYGSGVFKSVPVWWDFVMVMVIRCHPVSYGIWCAISKGKSRRSWMFMLTSLYIFNCGFHGFNFMLLTFCLHQVQHLCFQSSHENGFFFLVRKTMRQQKILFTKF